MPLKTYLAWHFHSSNKTSLKHVMGKLSCPSGHIWWSHVISHVQCKNPSRLRLIDVSSDCPPPHCSDILTCIHTCIHGTKNKQLLMGCQRVSSMRSSRPLSPSCRQSLSHRQELSIQDRLKLKPKSLRSHWLKVSPMTTLSQALCPKS